MMSNEKIVESSNKNVQTIIHCFPHVLTPDDNIVKVFCDRSCQTAVSTPPETSNLDFYALLEFVPYQVIAKSCIKELDLPRRPLLHFALSSEDRSCNSPGKSSELDLKRGVLKKSNSELNSVTSFSRALSHPVHVMHKTVVESQIQTMLSVTPHILDTDEVASVFTEVPIQTSITFVPNESDSTVIPKLQANLNHISNSNAVLLPRLSTVSESEIEINELIELTQAENNLTDKDVEKPKYALQDTVNIPPLRNCQVGRNVEEKPLNKIASQLRVQLSTLELTPSVFPPELEFEGRMMEVLNTTVAVFQTEMAKVLEMYHDANNTNTQYLERDKSTKSQPSCSCRNEKPKIPSAHSDSDVLTVEENGEFSSTIEQASNKALRSSLEQRQESDLKATTILHEIIGDISENKRTIFIPCECHPSSFGAAPPIVTDLSTFSNEDLSVSTDLAGASSYANDDLSMITNDASSLADDLTNSENTTKFEAILDLNISDMVSTSATRAIAVRAIVSCPNTIKTSKFNSGANLSDLKDQVIRLSAIHKKAPGLQIEETLTSCHPIITTPHTSCTSYATTLKNFNVSHVADESAPTCNTTVGQKESSKHCNKINKCTSISKRTYISEESKSSKLNLQFTQNCNAHIQPNTSVNKSVSLIECPAQKSSPYRFCTPHNDEIVSRSRNLSVFNGCEVTYSLPTKDETFNNNFMFQQYIREPFMEKRVKTEDLSAGVQTDLTLGDMLNSESLSSINIEVEVTQTKSKSQTKVPLKTISLMSAGTNNTQLSESKNSLVEDVASDLDSTKEEREKYNANKRYIPFVPWKDIIVSNNSTIEKVMNHEDASNKPSEKSENADKGILVIRIGIDTLPSCLLSKNSKSVSPQAMAIPWNDISVSKTYKIEKVTNHYEDACNETSEKSENADKGFPVIRMGIDTVPSCSLPVNSKSISHQELSVCSDTLQQPKRVPKQLTLHINFTNYSNVSISVEDINATMTIPGAESKSSKHIKVSGRCLNKDSDIINIKASAVCRFLSEKFILNKSSAEVKVNKPLLHPCNILQTKSCSVMQPSNISGKPSVNSTFKSCTSTPEVCSNLFVEITVSNKNVDKLENVVDTAKPADAPTTNCEYSGKPKPEAAISTKNVDKSENVIDTAKPADTPTTNCKYAGKPKPDAVLTVIEAYEAEIKPLMDAVDELHEKVKRLNITDMPDCGSALIHNLPREETLTSYPQCMSYQKREPERLVNTSSIIPFTKTTNHYSSGTCPYFVNLQHNNMSAPMPPYTYQSYMPIICRCAISPSPDSRSGCYNCNKNNKSTDDSKINKNFQTEPKTPTDARNCNRRNQGGNSCTPLSKLLSEVIYKNASAAVPSYTYETNLPSSTSPLLNSSLGQFCHRKQISTETSNASKCVQVEIKTFKPTEDFNAMYPEEKEISCCFFGPSLTDTMHRNASNSVLSYPQQTVISRTALFAMVPLSNKHCCDDNQSLTNVDEATKNVQVKTEMYKAPENDSRTYQDEKQEPCFPCGSPLPDALYKNTPVPLPSCQTRDISTSAPTYTSQNQTPGASVSMTTPDTKLGSYRYDSQAVTQNVKVNKDAQEGTEMYKAPENDGKKYKDGKQKACFTCGSPLPDALYKNTPAPLPSCQTRDISTSAPTYTSQNQTPGASVSMNTPDTKLGSYRYDSQSITRNVKVNKDAQGETEMYKAPENDSKKYQDGKQNPCFPCGSPLPDALYKNTPVPLPSCQTQDISTPTYTSQNQTPGASVSMTSPNTKLGSYRYDSQAVTQNVKVNKDAQGGTEMYKASENDSTKYQDRKQNPCFPCGSPLPDPLYKNTPTPLPSCQTRDISTSAPTYTSQNQTPGASVSMTTPDTKLGSYRYDSQAVTQNVKVNKNAQGETEMYKASENDSRTYQDGKQKPCFPCGSPLPDALYKNTPVPLPSCQTRDISTSAPIYTSQNQPPGASVSMTTPDTKLGSYRYDSQAVTQNVKVNKNAQGETEMYKAPENDSRTYQDGKQKPCFPCGSPLPDALYKNTPVPLPSCQTRDISTSAPIYTSQNQPPGASVSMTTPDTKLGSYRYDSQAVTQNVKVNKYAQGETEMYKAPENDSRKYQDGKQKPCFPFGSPFPDALYKNTPVPLPSCQTRDISTFAPTYTSQNQTSGAAVSMTTPVTKLRSYPYNSPAVTHNVNVNKNAQRETGVHKTTESRNRKYQKSCFPCGQGVNATYNKTPASFASYKYQAPLSGVSTPLRNPHLEYYSNNNLILNNNCNANQNLQRETGSCFTTERSRMNQEEQQQSYYPSSSNTMYKTTSGLTPAYTYQMPIPSTYNYTAPQFPYIQSDYFCPDNQIPDNGSRFPKKDFQMEIETYKILKNYANQYEDDVQNLYYQYDPFIYNKISTSMQQYEYPNNIPTASTCMTSPLSDLQLGYSCPNPNQVLINKENAATETYNTMKNYNRKDQYVACGSSEKCRNLNNSRSSESTAFAKTVADGTSFAETHHKPHRHRLKPKDGKRLIHSCKPKSVVGFQKTNNQNGCLPCVDAFEKYVRPDQAVKTSPEEFLCFSNSHEGKRNGNETF